MEAISAIFVRFSIKEQTLFAKRLSFLMTAGVPIVECLHVLRAQTASKAKVKILDAVISDVSGGQFLSTSLSKHGRLFSDLVVNLIRVGESSGTLGLNLSYIADELKKKHALKTKVMGALWYPLFITIGTVGITAMLIVYIFPKILPIFLSLHVALPLSTRIVISLSHFLSSFGVWCLLFLAVLLGAFFFVRGKSVRVRWWGDRLVLATPLAGGLVRSYNLANFCRTLGLLLNSGMRLSDALIIAADVTHNVVFKKAYQDISNTVLRGESVSRGLERRPDLFPDMMRHLVAVGERTGALSQSLMYVCEMHEGDVDEQTKRLSSAIEPVLMVVMGLLVGFVAIAVITPMYEITSHLAPR